jgi:hypothetical protein
MVMPPRDYQAILEVLTNLYPVWPPTDIELEEICNTVVECLRANNVDYKDWR